jgi:tetratricopeptide (TPR) repeat protein
MQHGDPTNIDRSTCVTLLSLLGFGYEFLGKAQAASQFYSEALQIEPDNDALHVARGMLMYGIDSRANRDFETAIQLDTPLVWPYVMLAHHHLVSGRFEVRRKLCERALGMGGSAAVESEVFEWLAIAQAQLGFPVDMVRTSFDKSIQHDPSNERAKRNLAAFEGGTQADHMGDSHYGRHPNVGFSRETLRSRSVIQYAHRHSTLPRNSQFLRPRATCFINCSTSLLSIGIRPSRRKSCNASRRPHSVSSAT